jgi:hypothetical protein
MPSLPDLVVLSSLLLLSFLLLLFPLYFLSQALYRRRKG